MKTSLFFLAAILLASVLACGGSQSTEPKATSDPLESAWFACKMFIEDQLGLPLSDAQKYNSSLVTVLPDNQYQTQVYYAKYSTTYRCVILQRPDGDWQLVSLQAK